MSESNRRALRACHSRSVLLAHVIWTTHDRQPRLARSADTWLASWLSHKATELGCRLLACGNADDHVHLVLRYPVTLCVADLVHGLKGACSHAWNLSLAARLGRLAWQTGYWAESVSPTDLARLMSYVLHQREHHDGRSTSEIWEALLSRHPRQPSAAGLRDETVP